MNFSIDFNTKKLEDLIMMTRDSLLSAIEDLATAATNETVVVKAALDTMSEVVVSLKAQVASLELAAGTAADFSAESAKLEDVRKAIGAIYEPPAAPVVAPVEPAPAVEPTAPVAPAVDAVPSAAPVVA